MVYKHPRQKKDPENLNFQGLRFKLILFKLVSSFSKEAK